MNCQARVLDWENRVERSTVEQSWGPQLARKKLELFFNKHNAACAFSGMLSTASVHLLKV